MTEYRVLHISDMHLSQVRPHNVRNWDFCVAKIEELQPDFVVVGGDMVLDDPDAADDHAFAHAQISRITVPWRALAGNHDVGDTAPAPYQGQLVSNERRKRFLSLYGADYWARDLGDWRLIGLNDLIFASELEAEREQATWLAARLKEWREKPIALFLHKPLCLDTLSETVITQAAVTPVGRSRLLELIADSDVRLIGSAHTHRHRNFLCDSIAMIWTPTIGQVNQGFRVPRGGDQRTGWIMYTFRGQEVEWELMHFPELQPVDISELVKNYKAMRFVPPALSAALS